MTDKKDIENKDIIKEEENIESAPEKSEVDSLNEKIADITDKYLRTVAELENTRRRAAIDSESVARNRAMNIVEKFLPLIDAIEAAENHAPDDEGIKTLIKAATNVLSKIGITKIQTVGEKLNPIFHNAISVADKPDENTITDTVASEMQPGYMFGDTVLRPAMVSVYK